MSVAFNISFPKLEIEKDSRNIKVSFLTPKKMNAVPATSVIDYWTITDHRGCVVRDEPVGENSYILADKYGKGIVLTMKGAGFQLAYDALNVCIHFITQDGKSISFHYKYSKFTKNLAFAKIIEQDSTDDEKDLMLEILKKAVEPKPSPSVDPMPGGTPAGGSGFADEIKTFIQAAEHEIRFLRGNGGRKYKVTNGQFVTQTHGYYAYSFDLDAELFLADDAPVTVTVGLDSIPGTVMLCENFQIIVALERIPYMDKSLKIPKATISAEPWKLLVKLNERLARINATNKIAFSLIEEGPKLAISAPMSTIIKGQGAAYNHAISSPITVIWGPPGTGKTYTMARIAYEFLRQGKRVLIVAHSNVSVDNVAKQIYNQIKDSPLAPLLDASKILRYGYVRDDELKKNDIVASYEVSLKNSSDKEAYEKIKKEYQELKATSEASNDADIQKRILEINQKLKVFRARHKETEKRLVANAQLIATTVSKIYADTLFEDRSYDVVMFDEISMAYVSQIVAASSFATEHLICVGDFRQLSPIVQEKNAKAVLGKDLFEYLNICDGYNAIKTHPWLVMLDEQRRMHPAISAFPSRYVYSGLLKDHESVSEKRKSIAEADPFNLPMCLIDLYGTCCFGSKNEDNSRYNILSAVFAFATALMAEKSQVDFTDVSDEEKVGIITPYAAQTRLIKAMILDYRRSNRSENKTNISCATVHQFQGSERNVVVFDAVESCPSTRAGWLMSKNEGGAVTRLINVALTRSRGKFVAIANKTFWLNKFESNNMFYSLVKYMSSSSHILDYHAEGLKKYISSIYFGSSIKVFTSTISSNVDVLDDIRNAKSNIMLMIPQGRINPEYAETILSEIYAKSRQGVAVAIVHDRMSSIPDIYQDISVSSDKVTMPLLFVDNTVWYGLPIYSHACSDSKISYPIYVDIIVRFKGNFTVEMIRSLVEHGAVKPPAMNGFALYVRNNCTCSACGEPLTLFKANRHFMRCKKCGKSHAISTTIVNFYLDSTGGKCPLCRCDQMALNGHYGIYVRCSNNHTFKLDEI